MHAFHSIHGDDEESSNVRRLIRSHVMMGKNKGKARTVRATKQTRCADAASTSSSDVLEASQEDSLPITSPELPVLGFVDPLRVSVFADILASEYTRASTQRCFF